MSSVPGIVTAQSISSALGMRSDWPVSEQTHRYATWVEVVDRTLGGASDLERRRLFRDNAIAFYRLGAA